MDKNTNERDQFNGDAEDVQLALNQAREHRNTELTNQNNVPEYGKHERNGPRGSYSSRNSNNSRNLRDVKREQKVYYNPANDKENDDAQSVATTTVSMAGEYRDNKGRPMQVVAIPAGAKIKTVGDSESSNGEEYENLTYEEIQTNLRLLSDLIQHEKIHVSSDRKKMIVDNRYDVMGLRRKWSGDSRTKTLEFIKHIYAQTEELCNNIVTLVNNREKPKENTEKLINIYGLIQASNKGLDRLNMTYANDKFFTAMVATIKKGNETYCDRTLKGTIDGFKKNYQ